MNGTRVSFFSLRAECGRQGGKPEKAWEGEPEKGRDPGRSGFGGRPHYGLNDEQWTAASAKKAPWPSSPAPEPARPGPLVCRIAYLVEERGVDPAHITAVTFTNKAAREMKERLLAHFGDKRTVKAMTIGTFHAICLNRLSERKEPAAVLDQEEAVAIALEILDELGLKLSVREALQAVSARKSGLDGWENEGKAGPYSLFTMPIRSGCRICRCWISTICCFGSCRRRRGNRSQRVHPSARRRIPGYQSRSVPAHPGMEPGRGEPLRHRGSGSGDLWIPWFRRPLFRPAAGGTAGA